MPPTLDQHVRRALEALRRPHVGRFIRYSAVSVISSVLSLVLLYVFYRVLKVGSAALSNVYATAIATVPSYYLNRTWAWKRGGRSHLWKEVVPFWVIAFVSLALSTAAVALASHLAQRLGASHRAETIAVEFANFFTYGVLWVGKFFFFNHVLFAHRLSDDDDEGPAGPSGPITDGVQILSS